MLENGKYTETIHAMTGTEIWAAWKNQQLINQVVLWQQKHKLFFNSKGEIVNE